MDETLDFNADDCGLDKVKDYRKGRKDRENLLVQLEAQKIPYNLNIPISSGCLLFAMSIRIRLRKDLAP